jgi:hypothetical protein
MQRLNWLSTNDQDRTAKDDAAKDDAPNGSYRK